MKESCNNCRWKHEPVNNFPCKYCEYADEWEEESEVEE